MLVPRAGETPTRLVRAPGMIPKRPVPGLIRDGNRFSDEIMPRGKWRSCRRHTAAIMVNGWLIGACELAAAPATGSQSGLGFVVTGNFVDFFRRHMPGDVAHLLADIITACARGESPQFRPDINGGLAAQPRTTGPGVRIGHAGNATA